MAPVTAQVMMTFLLLLVPRSPNKTQSDSTLPQTLIDWPQMFHPALEQRKITAEATSSGVTM
jgi:hypothetical protein